MNCLYGENLRNDIDETFACKSEYWMMSEYDVEVRDYWRISNGKSFVKMTDDARLEDEVENSNTMPLYPCSFVLSNSKRIVKEFIHDFNEIYTNDLYYTDTDSLYIENKHSDKSDKTGLVGKALIQRKNDY